MNRHLKGGANIHRAVAALIRRRCLWPALLVAPVLGLAACGGGGGNGPGSENLALVIGNSLPLHGASRTLGESGAKASQLAVNQIKQAIAQVGAGHTVRVVSADQGPDASAAAGSAKTLVSDGANCLTGPWSSDAVEQTAKDVAIPAKVPEISPVATPENVSEISDHDLVDSTALPDSLEGTALATAIGRDLGGVRGHSVNVAAGHESYGDELSHDFLDEWHGQDGTVAGQTMLAPPPLGAPLSEAQEITAGAPNAVLLIDDITGFSQLVPALSSTSSWNPAATWGSDRLVSPGLPGLVGADAIDGMRALAPGAPNGAVATTAFASDFKSAQPRRVRLAPYAAQEFDATVLCYLAAVAAGSTEGQQMADKLIDITAPGGEEFSWQQLPDAVKALEDGKDIDYMGASGPIDMNVHGDPTAGVYDVYRYGPGGLKVVDQVSVSTPNPATP